MWPRSTYYLDYISTIFQFILIQRVTLGYAGYSYWGDTNINTQHHISEKWFMWPATYTGNCLRDFINMLRSEIPQDWLAAFHEYMLCSFRYFMKAIGPLPIEIMHFEDLGDIVSFGCERSCYNCSGHLNIIGHIYKYKYPSCKKVNICDPDLRII